MPNESILVLGHIGVIAVLALIGVGIFRRSFNLGWLVAALVLYAVYDFLLTRGFHAIPNWPEGADWNWLGKIMSFAGMLIVAALPMFGFKRTGVTLKQAPNSLLAYVLFAGLSALFFYFAISGADGKPDDLETIAFQWTMPGLDEELFFRGVFLLAMNEAFSPRANILGARIGYGGLLTSVVFGLVHAMDYGAGGFSFDAMTFTVTGGPSLLLLWLREKTGSLLLPVIAHNIANGAFTLF
ncbi:MAG: CPBP family intramembrane glutamic endopeptidase [Parvularculaceae bacterium]